MDERIKSNLKELDELIKLKEEKADLKEKITKAKIHNFKNFNVRNLKVFTKTINLLSPFLVTSGLIIGIFKFLGLGYPFKSDKINKYKLYSMDYRPNGYVTMEEEYTVDSVPDNTLIMYTPWEFEDGEYVRYKREYKIGKLDSMNLINAVLKKDYETIINTLNKFNEEKQIINKINPENGNDYTFEANLYYKDENDIKKLYESTKDNIYKTILELLVIILTNLIVYRIFNYKKVYSNEIHEINNDYHNSCIKTESIQESLDSVNKKILFLTKGDRNNE